MTHVLNRRLQRTRTPFDVYGLYRSVCIRGAAVGGFPNPDTVYRASLSALLVMYVDRDVCSIASTRNFYNVMYGRSCGCTTFRTFRAYWQLLHTAQTHCYLRFMEYRLKVTSPPRNYPIPDIYVTKYPRLETHKTYPFSFPKPGGFGSRRDARRRLNMMTVFREMRNHYEKHTYTDIGTQLLNTYETYFLDYENDHPQDLNVVSCARCGGVPPRRANGEFFVKQLVGNKCARAEVDAQKQETASLVDDGSNGVPVSPPVSTPSTPDALTKELMSPGVIHVGGGATWATEGVCVVVGGGAVLTGGCAMDARMDYAAVAAKTCQNQIGWVECDCCRVLTHVDCARPGSADLTPSGEVAWFVCDRCASRRSGDAPFDAVPRGVVPNTPSNHSARTHAVGFGTTSGTIGKSPLSSRARSFSASAGAMRMANTGANTGNTAANHTHAATAANAAPRKNGTLLKRDRYGAKREHARGVESTRVESMNLGRSQSPLIPQAGLYGSNRPSSRSPNLFPQAQQLSVPLSYAQQESRLNELPAQHGSLQPSRPQHGGYVGGYHQPQPTRGEFTNAPPYGTGQGARYPPGYTQGGYRERGGEVRDVKARTAEWHRTQERESAVAAAAHAAMEIEAEMEVEEKRKELASFEEYERSRPPGFPSVVNDAGDGGSAEAPGRPLPGREIPGRDIPGTRRTNTEAQALAQAPPLPHSSSPRNARPALGSLPSVLLRRSNSQQNVLNALVNDECPGSPGGASSPRGMERVSSQQNIQMLTSLTRSASQCSLGAEHFWSGLLGSTGGNTGAGGSQGMPDENEAVATGPDLFAFT